MVSPREAFKNTFFSIVFLRSNKTGLCFKQPCIRGRLSVELLTGTRSSYDLKIGSARPSRKMESIFVLSHTHVSTPAQKTRLFKARPGRNKIIQVDCHRPVVIPCAPTPQRIARKQVQRQGVDTFVVTMRFIIELRQPSRGTFEWG
jgi:hypothetical protein